jgi:hypothetical protein
MHRRVAWDGGMAFRPLVASTRRHIRNRRGSLMNVLKLVAIALIAAGVLALAYGGFSYTKETHKASVGPVELAVKDKETVNVPVWAGVLAVAVGAGLLVMGSRRA